MKLDVSAHRYSLIAIKDSFMGYKSNRILTKYFEGKWNEYMFLSFPTAAERDEESLKNAIGAALKIPRDVIHLYQKASIYQPKISQDWNTVRAYYNTYYVVYIDSFPELLKNNEFEIDGVHYKWMTLEQMEREAEKKSIIRMNEGHLPDIFLHLPDIRIYTQNQEKMYGKCRIMCVFG